MRKWYSILRTFPVDSSSSLLCHRYWQLEVLLTPYKTEAGLRVHIALDMERGSETLGTTEKDTGFGR